VHNAAAPACCGSRCMFQLSCLPVSLQVLSSAGTWQPVALTQNQVAVFAGEALEHATTGAIHAAVHRVSQSEVRRTPCCYLAFAQLICVLQLAVHPVAECFMPLRPVTGYINKAVTFRRSAASHGCHCPISSGPHHTASLTFETCPTSCRTRGALHRCLCAVCSLILVVERCHVWAMS
jgi:hypothetical protein